MHMDDQTIAMIVSSYMHKISSSTFVSKPNRDRDREFEKSKAKPETSGHWRPLVSAPLSIFQIIFPETGCHAKNAPTRPETVTTCPALPT